jgi:hypothetical protein
VINVVDAFMCNYDMMNKINMVLELGIDNCLDRRKKAPRYEAVY